MRSTNADSVQLNGSMGYANAQRLLDIIRTLTQFISQPEYRNLSECGIFNADHYVF